MKIMILCGGFGTRLAGVAGDVPKPLVPVGGRPILWHIMRGFAHWGFNDFVLCLGYRSDLFKQFFLNLPVMCSDVTIIHHNRVTCVSGAEDWRITLVETGLASATGTRIRVASALLDADDEEFGVTYGDGVSDVDFRRVVAFHRASGKIGTVTAVRPAGRFGELTLNRHGSIVSFNEKPQAAAGWISGGFFVFSRAVLSVLKPDEDEMLEGAPLQALVRDGELAAYRHDGFWACVDTPRDHATLSDLCHGGRAPWMVWCNNAEVRSQSASPEELVTGPAFR